jgi:hypothetical protein
MYPSPLSRAAGWSYSLSASLAGGLGGLVPCLRRRGQGSRAGPEAVRVSGWSPRWLRTRAIRRVRRMERA